MLRALRSVLGALGLLLLFGAGFLLAQDPVPVPPTPAPISEWAVGAILALVPIVVGILKWVTARYASEIPNWSKPVIATALGAAAAWLGGLVVTNPILAALVGLATVGIREVIVQLGRAVGMLPRPFRG